MLHCPGLGEEAWSTAVDTGQPTGWGQLERGAQLSVRVVVIVEEPSLPMSSSSLWKGCHMGPRHRRGGGCRAGSPHRRGWGGGVGLAHVFVLVVLVVPEGLSRGASSSRKECHAAYAGSARVVVPVTGGVTRGLLTSSSRKGYRAGLAVVADGGVA